MDIPRLYPKALLLRRLVKPQALTTFLLIGTEALTFLLSSILVRLRMERAVERSVERQSRMVVQPCGVPDLFRPSISQCLSRAVSESCRLVMVPV